MKLQTPPPLSPFTFPITHLHFSVDNQRTPPCLLPFIHSFSKSITDPPKSKSIPHVTNTHKIDPLSLSLFSTSSGTNQVLDRSPVQHHHHHQKERPPSPPPHQPPPNMQGIQPYRPFSDPAGFGVRLELSTSMTNSSPLAIDIAESTEMRIQRLISENPVVIFSRSSCCMCHVMKKLLSTLGVHPTVIELNEDEINALPAPPDGTIDHQPEEEEEEEEDVAVVVVEDDVGGGSSGGGGGGTTRARSKRVVPAVFIGGNRVGGLESLVALHVSGLLVPKLAEVGAYN